jgi:hypothetical protein
LAEVAELLVQPFSVLNLHKHLTPKFSGGLCVAKRRKGRPVEALQGRNVLE